MQSEAIDRLIRILLDATNGRAIRWAPHRGYPHSFEHQRQTGWVVIESRDADGVAPFQLKVVDNDGQETDQFVDRDSSSDLPKLYHVIARSVNGADAPSPVLREIVAELERAVPA